MPRRDKTGPMGAGSMTGRGLEICSSLMNRKLYDKIDSKLLMSN
ncbi:MAG TPA: DUF5320 domain-containing protein [Soehngenia sp.]|nr:DUF5320 domain-containing protein [Soehngenia sp.]HPP31044.1 DUF5320 domain-containing protein [Soehngenia sp.]